MNQQVTIGIDPGLMGTGIAIMTQQEHNKEFAPLLQVTKVIQPIKNEFLIERIHQMATSTASFINDECNTHNHNLRQFIICIEQPEIWSSSETSMASATRGDILKLSMLIGYLLRCLSQHRNKIMLVTPAQWKGQLSKKAAIARIQRRFNNHQFRVKVNQSTWHVPTSHDADALGIALFVLGIF